MGPNNCENYAVREYLKGVRDQILRLNESVCSRIQDSGLFLESDFPEEVTVRTVALVSLLDELIGKLESFDKKSGCQPAFRKLKDHL